jgi:hypothetical protein
MSEELERRFLKLEDDYEVFKKKVLRHLADKSLHGRVDIKEASETERRFPIQGGLTISWEAAEHAYMTYYKFYGRDQTLERLAERGGFGLHEFALLYLGKRGTESLNGMGNRIAEVLAKADVRSTRRS